MTFGRRKTLSAMSESTKRARCSLGKLSYAMIMCSLVYGVVFLVSALRRRTLTTSQDRFSEGFNSLATTSKHRFTEGSISLATPFNPLNEYISKLPKGGAKRFCPCCGWSGYSFEGTQFSGLGKTIPDRKCPRCGGLERHRKACAMIGCQDHNHSHLLTRVDESTPFRLLHFGPEKEMMKFMDKFVPSISQIGLDYFAKGYGGAYDKTRTLHGDVTDLQFPDNFANGIIILHVLEHIAKLEIALSELKRVLAPSGWIMMEVPCKKDGETQDCRQWAKNETASIKCAGQRDHVWYFNCRDFQRRVEETASMECHAWFQLDHHKHCFDDHLRNAVLPTAVAATVPTLLCREKR